MIAGAEAGMPRERSPRPRRSRASPRRHRRAARTTVRRSSIPASRGRARCTGPGPPSRRRRGRGPPRCGTPSRWEPETRGGEPQAATGGCSGASEPFCNQSTRDRLVGSGGAERGSDPLPRGPAGADRALPGVVAGTRGGRAAARRAELPRVRPGVRPRPHHAPSRHRGRAALSLPPRLGPDHRRVRARGGARPHRDR